MFVIHQTRPQPAAIPGVAHATCNGELLEAALALPASGPIGVEGDRGQMEYRRIRIRVLSR